MSDLIKRIDDAIANMAINSGLLRDCRAEIERLRKPYVPMTDDEFRKLVVDWHDKGGNFAWPQYIEQAVVKRFLNPGDNNDS